MAQNESHCFPGTEDLIWKKKYAHLNTSQVEHKKAKTTSELLKKKVNSLRTSHTNLKQMWHGITTGSLLKNNDRVLQHGRILATIKSMSVWTFKCKLMFLMESQGVLSFIKRSKHWRFLDMCRKFWINFRQRTVNRAGKLNSGLLLRITESVRR